MIGTFVSRCRSHASAVANHIDRRHIDLRHPERPAALVVTFDAGSDRNPFLVFVAVAGRPTVRCQTGSLEALQPALLTGDQRHVLSARGFSIAPSGQTAEREIATADPRWTMREAVFALEVLFEAFQYRTGWLRTSIGH